MSIMQILLLSFFIFAYGNFSSLFFCFNQCALIRQGILHNRSDLCSVIILITILQTGSSQYIQACFCLCTATVRNVQVTAVWQLILLYVCPNNNWNLFRLPFQHSCQFVPAILQKVLLFLVLDHLAYWLFESILDYSSP